MSYAVPMSAFSVGMPIETLSESELDQICGGSATAQYLRDVAAAAGIVGTVAAIGGAEPVAIGAGVVGGVALLAAAIIG